jgi:hypothetical protein
MLNKLLLFIFFLPFNLVAGSNNSFYNYKDFVFEYSMRPNIAMYLKPIKRIATDLCGKNIFKDKGGKYDCKFAINEESIKIKRIYDTKNEEYVYYPKNNILKKIN